MLKPTFKTLLKSRIAAFSSSILRQSPNLITHSRSSSTASPFLVFDRDAKKWHRNRSVRNEGLVSSQATDYIKDEVAERLLERLQVIKRKFPTIVELGAGAGHLIKCIEEDTTSKLIMCDQAEMLLNRDIKSEHEFTNVERRTMDEENITFEPNSIPAIVSSLSLHWVNDLPGALIQINQALQPDGLFLAAMFGGETLFELRTSLQVAELERSGGFSPRVSPFAESRDIANLLTRAGFALTTVDVDEIVVNYPSMFHLIEDLDAMGESNAIIARHHFIKRDILMAASAIYQAAHGNDDGSIPATFQVIFMIGWKPDSNQPKPKSRGSAKTSLKSAL